MLKCSADCFPQYPTEKPKIPMRNDTLLLILKSTRELIKHGFTTGTYCKRTDGTPCGTSCTQANAYDLAGALWHACDLHNPDRREALFADAWVAVKTRLGKPNEKSPDLCRWLDHRSQTWHLEFLTDFIGDGEQISAAPRSVSRRGTVDMTEYS
jgi:hypothetical protein